MLRLLIALCALVAPVWGEEDKITINPHFFDDKKIDSKEFEAIMSQLLAKAKSMGKLDGGKGPDMNKDGKIDMDDAKMIFGFIDADHSGDVSLEEVAALKEMFMQATGKAKAESPAQNNNNLGPYILGASVVMAAAIVYSKPRPTASIVPMQ
jgi:hypothetical protein